MPAIIPIRAIQEKLTFPALRSVDNALHEVIQTWGHKTPEEAAAYVADMKQHRRYQRDVY